MSFIQEEVDVEQVLLKLLDKQCIFCLTQGPTRSYNNVRSEPYACEVDSYSSNNPCCFNCKHPLKSAVFLFSHRRHPWTIYWSAESIWIRRVSRWCKLSLHWRLCRQGKELNRMHDAFTLLQAQVPRKLLFTSRQPLKLQHQPYLRFLRWVYPFFNAGKRRYNLKIWKYFLDVFNVMPVCALID